MDCGYTERGENFVRQMLHDEMIRRKARGQFIFQSELELDTAIEGWLREWLKDANKRVAGAKSLNPKDVASVRADFAKLLLIINHLILNCLFRGGTDVDEQELRAL